MITDQDRSGYIGASDVEYVLSYKSKPGWKPSKTWEKWWMTKLGVNKERYDNRYTLAGTNWEHKILDSLYVPGLQKDAQFIMEDIRLRVNLDGNTPGRIKEVKTYQHEKGFKLPKKYIHQVQVQMYCSKIYGADIVTYGLQPPDYDNYFRPVDPGRIKEYPVSYDPNWIETEYLPKHMALAEALKRGVFPHY